MQSSVASGPGRTWYTASVLVNVASETQRSSSTNSCFIAAICAAGPPQAREPSLKKRGKIAVAESRSPVVALVVGRFRGGQSARIREAIVSAAHPYCPAQGGLNGHQGRLHRHSFTGRGSRQGVLRGQARAARG